MKRAVLTVITACGMAFGAALLGTVAHAQGNSDVQNGFDLAPVPLTLNGLNKSLVGKGSYIVNAQGACNDCHTNPPYTPEGDPYNGKPKVINAAGYLGGGMMFGPFTSRNLTPRASNGRPAGLTLDQFKEVMHNGTDFKNVHPQISPLLQVMPWPVYGEMTDKDLEAVYEYLRAIPCVGSPSRCGT
jgi:hypothetical protein